MSSRITSVLALSLLLAQAVLAKVDVYPGQVPLSNYKTFKWVRTRLFTAKQGFTEEDPVVTPAIKKAVTEKLVKAGMVEVMENPDIEIYTLAQGSAVPTVDIMMLGVNAEPTINSMAAYSPGVRTIAMGGYNKEGTLVVNLLDPKTQKSAWLGVVTKSLGKPENLDKDVNKAVDTLFKKFKR